MPVANGKVNLTRNKVNPNPNLTRSKTKLLEYINSIPKLHFTSGDITTFIDDRPSYTAAWNAIKTEGKVKRLSVPKGTATLWTRSDAKVSK